MVAYSPMVWGPNSKMLVVFVDSQRSTHSRKSDSGSLFAHGLGTHSKMLVVFVDSQRSTHSRKSDSGSVFVHGLGTP